MPSTGTGTKNFPNFPHSGSEPREPSRRRRRPHSQMRKAGLTICYRSRKSIHKQQTTIRQPIECAPEASSGGREWAEMTEGFHLEATRRKVLTYVPSEKK